jgi:hypothetical protein
MGLFTAAVTSRESGGQPYTLVELFGEADVTVSGNLRGILDAEALHVILAAGMLTIQLGVGIAGAFARRPALVFPAPEEKVITVDTDLLSDTFIGLADRSARLLSASAAGAARRPAGRAAGDTPS